MSDAVEALRRCTPSRRSLKFRPGQYARHFLAFDASISRESRMLLYMRIFAFSSRLVDTDILPQYQAATYFPEEALEVRIVTDCRHPAYGQAGLYAKRTIPSNVVVVPYSGFLEIFSTSSNSRTYTMGFGSINDDYALDAEFAGNYGRFANDPRGVDGLQANLGAESRFSARGEAYTALVSRRQILKGEELLMAYGKAHSLSSSAWANVKGDFVLRPRLGGVVPVPSLHPTVTSNSTSTGDNSGSGTATDYHVMWECTQCGMWNGEEHPGAPTLPRCCFCTSPRLSGARMATVLSPPVPSPQVLLLDTLGSQEAIDEARKRCRVDESYVEPLSKVEPIDKGAVGTKSRQTTIYDSTAVDWPLNVPFLSWQVWDPSVPVTAIIKHSRFEVHEHVLLYNIIHNANDEEDGDGDPASPANGEGSGSTRSRVQPNRRRNPRASKRTRNNTTEVLWKRLDTKEEPPLRGAPRRPRDVNCARPSILDRLLSTQDAEGWLPLRHLCSEEQNMSECAVSDLHQRLQNLNRRPFSGKSFEAGEQVAVLGGTIRLAADLRCRPDGSPLSIPLHHLAPRSWRKALQKHAGEGDVALTEANRFIRSLEELALVVTNELMFCPVIGIVDECSCHSSDCACQLESLLKEACNVVVILTIDSLGNPYVAAVASRHIGAFEPLLARTQ